MIVNVCPAATTSAPADRLWELLTDPERFEVWQGAKLVSALTPAGPGETLVRFN